MTIYKPTSATDAAGGSLVQDDQDNTAQTPSYFFAASADSYITMPSSAQFNSGLDDFTIIAKVKASPSASYQQISLYREGASSVALDLGIYPGTHKPYLFTRTAGGANATTTQALAAMSNNKPSTIAVIRKSTTTQFFQNGIAEAAQTVAAVNVAPTTIFDQNRIGWTSLSIAGGNVYRYLRFNYALSTDKVRRYSAGAKLDFDDIGGSMTALLTGEASTWTTERALGSSQFNGWDMTAGVNIGAGTLAGVTAGKGAFSITSGGATRYIEHQTLVLTTGKRYRISVKVRYVSGNNQTLYVGTNITGGVSSSLTAITPTGTEQTVTTELTAQGTKLQFGAIGTGTLTGLFEVDDVLVTQLGAVLDLEPESATPSVWHDESGNALDGAVTGATLVNTPKYLNTDYGTVATKQELVYNSVDKPSYYHPSKGTYIEIIGGTKMSFGTGDLTVLYVAATAELPATALNYLGYASGGGFFGVALASSGTYFRIREGATTYDSGVNLTKTNEPFCLMIRRSGGKIRPYLNGVADTKDIDAAASDIVSPTVYITNTSANAWLGSISRNIWFNYALSEDKIRRYSSGAKLDWEDIGGSMATKIINGDFGSATGWDTSALGTGGSLPGGSGKCTFGYGTDRSLAQTSANWVSGYTAGKRYRITYTVESNTLVGSYSFQICDAYWSGVEIMGGGTAVALPSTASGTPYVVEFTATNTGCTQFRIGLRGTTTSGTMVIESLSIIQLGAVLDLEPEGIGEGTWVDSSPNALHGDVSGALAMFPQQSSLPGTWTPTISNTANLDSTPTLTASSARYRVVNGVCFFEFKVDGVDCTTADTFSYFCYTLPVKQRANASYMNGTITVANSGGTERDFGTLGDQTGSDRTGGSALWYPRKTGTSSGGTAIVSGWYFI